MFFSQLFPDLWHLAKETWGTSHKDAGEGRGMQKNQFFLGIIYRMRHMTLKSNSSRVLPTSQAVYQPTNHTKLVVYSEDTQNFHEFTGKINHS